MGLKAVATLVPGGGPPVGGSGTPGKLAKFTGAGTSIGDSLLSESGTTITSSGPIRATGTTATAPAFTGSDTDTGVYFPAANQVRIATSGTLAIAVDASQNVGIGTASATTSAATGSLVIGQNNVSQQWAARIYGGNDANRAPVLSLFRAGNTEGIIAEIKNGAVGALALGITGGVANFNDATLAAACQVQITSTLMDISGTNYGLKLPAVPGNADTQTLDCYQENPLATTAGNGWTPTLSAAATWGGTQPNVTYARYVRMGSMVFCEVKLTMGTGTMTSTYPLTTIDSPVATNTNANHSAVPVAAPGASGVGFQTGTTVYLPPIGASSTFILSWSFFA